MKPRNARMYLGFMVAGGDASAPVRRLRPRRNSAEKFFSAPRRSEDA